MEYKEQNMEYRIWNIEYWIQFFSNIKFNSPNSTFYILHSTQRGVATLPTVILISILALVIAVSLASLSFTELMVSQGSAQSSRALFYAEAGARDALIRIARDKNFATTSYSVDFTTNSTGCSPTWGGCATVSVSSGSPKIATSTGAMGASSRTLSVSATLDANGTITGTTWSEATN